MKVNGTPVPIALERGYVTITRDWKAGDTVSLDMEMPVRRVVANDLVAADRQRVALQRGPIVFAAEWPDNVDGRVRNLVLPDTSPLRSEFRPQLLGGVQVVTTRASGSPSTSVGRSRSKSRPSR